MRRQGRLCVIRLVLYHAHRKVPVDVIVYDDPTYQEPWYLLVLVAYRNPLATELVVDLYRERMQIEQSFRDFKTHLGLRGLNLQIDIAPRMGRLLLTFCLAYILCVLLGESSLGQQARKGFEIPRHADPISSQMGGTGHRFIAESNLEGLCTTPASLRHSTLSAPSLGALKNWGWARENFPLDFLFT
jgi:hypothetical protein